MEKNRLSKEWQELKISIGQNKEIFGAEVWGISEAFKVAEQRTRQVQQPLFIIIFCDSQTIINDLRDCHSSGGQALKMQIYVRSPAR